MEIESKESWIQRILGSQRSYGFMDHKEEAEFIELVHQYPPLWNTADTNFYKKALKKVLYTHIAEKLKERWPDKAHLLTYASLKKKFNGLRSYFIRELRKMKQWNETSPVTAFPKWIHFDKLLFIVENEGKNISEQDIDMSIVKVEEGINDDNEVQQSDMVSEKSFSDSNEGNDSFLLSQTSLQSTEEAVRISLKREILEDSSPASDSVVAETPDSAVAAETSSSDSNVAVDSPLLVQSNETVVGIPVKKEILDFSYPIESVTPVNPTVSETSFSDSSAIRKCSLLQSTRSSEANGLSLKKRILDSSFPGSVSVASETTVSATAAETTYSDCIAVRNSSLLLQSSVQSNEESPMSGELLDSSPMSDSIVTETPDKAISIGETSFSNRNVRTDSPLLLQSSVRSITTAEPSSFRRKIPINSASVYDSVSAPTPVILKKGSVPALGPFTSNASKNLFFLVPKRNQKAKETQSNKETTPPSLNTNNSSPEFDAETSLTPVLAEASCPNSNEGESSSQLSAEADEPFLKKMKLGESFSVCDSTEAPAALQLSSAFTQAPSAFSVALGNLVVASLSQMPAENANAATKEIFDVLLKYGKETNHPK